MNKDLIIKRGLKNLDKDCNTWYKRNGTLISSWASSADPVRKKRISDLINQLDERINTRIRIRMEWHQQKLQKDIAADFTLIMLECPNFFCRMDPEATGTAMYAKDYERSPEQHCNICGRELVIKGSDISDDLLDRGITPATWNTD